LRAVAATPLGTRSYALLGVEIFRPQHAGGHKVAVKGVLIPHGEASRLNVTSLQAVAGTCP
jgi:hypothetical protein